MEMIKYEGSLFILFSYRTNLHAIFRVEKSQVIFVYIHRQSTLINVFTTLFVKHQTTLIN